MHRLPPGSPASHRDRGGFAWLPLLPWILVASLFATGCGGGSPAAPGTGSGSGTGAPNSPPVAGDDAALAPQFGSVVVNVLGNDSDPDGNPLVVSAFTQGANGTVTMPTPNFPVYTPTGVFAGVDTFTYTLSDGRGGTDVGTVTVTVQAPNQAPTIGLPGAQIATEDQNLTLFFVPANAAIADPDFVDPDDELLVSLAVNDGVLTLATAAGLDFSIGDGLSDPSMLFEGTLAEVNAALNGLVYRGDPDFAGADSVFVFVDDRGVAGPGGILSASGNIPITVDPVNDPPVVTVPSTRVTLEDTNLTITGISIADIDAGTGSVQVTLGLVNGIATLNGTTGLTFTVGDGTQDPTMVFTGNLTNVNFALNGMVFRGTPDFNGNAMVTVAVDDQGNTGTGGPLTDVESFNVTVQAVNDAPVITLPGPASGPEDTDLVIAGLVVNDVDVGTGNCQLTLSVSQGRLILTTTAGLNFQTPAPPANPALPRPSFAFSGTLAQVQAAIAGLTYRPNLNFNGNDTLNISISDLGNSPNPPVLQDSDSLAITITAVNDAPVLAVPGAQVVDEDTTLFIPGITLADVDAAPGLLEVQLAVASGVLTLNSVTGLTFTTGDGTQDPAITFRGTLPNLNNAVANLRYRGNQDFNGSDTLTVVADDLGNSGAGGPLTTNNSVAITVNPVNDRPILSLPPLPISTDEDVVLPLSLISVADVDAGTSPIRMTLTAQNGTLTLASLVGLTFTSGTGTADAVMDFTGALADVNVAVAPLSYLGNLNYNGSELLSFLVSDQGASGSGGPLTTSGSLPMTIIPVNDVPVASTVNVTTPEDIPILITLVASDVDLDPLTFSIVTSSTNGALLGFNATAGTVTYRPNRNFFGFDSFTFDASDGLLTSTAATVNVSVTPVNDKLFATLDYAETLAGLGVNIDVLANDEDIDGDPLTTVGVTTPSNGVSALNPDDTVTYTPSPGFSGIDVFTYTASDGNGFQEIGSVVVLVEAYPLPSAMERVNLVSGGAQATAGTVSGAPSYSANGRLVAFSTTSDLLGAGDTNGLADIYVRDRLTGAVERVSVGPGGVQSLGGDSVEPFLSASGRFVVFASDATNLVPGDTNATRDVFLHDRLTAITERVSLGASAVQANAFSGTGSVSDDGNLVAFLSSATNLLVTTDINAADDVYVRDRALGTTVRANVSAGGSQTVTGSVTQDPMISGDGRFVAFTSTSDNLLTALDTNGVADVFVKELTPGAVTRSSVNSGATTEPNGVSGRPWITRDGRFVLFDSAATNLVANDTNGTGDVFLHDRSLSQTVRVNRSTSGAEAPAATVSLRGNVSDDGRYVVFETTATTLVPGVDGNGPLQDILVHDRVTGETTRVNRSATGIQANGASVQPRLSADGRQVVFFSDGTNLVTGDTNGLRDAFAVENPVPEATHRVSVDSNRVEGDNLSSRPTLALDGRRAFFASAATNLVAGDTNGSQDVFARDRLQGITSRSSVSGAGAEGNGDSFQPAAGWTGQFVAFASDATNLVAGDTNNSTDIFVRDDDNGTTVRASVATAGTQGNDDSTEPSLSADGRWVAFQSLASNLVTTDLNGVQDVFVRDVLLSTTEIVSVTDDGIQANNVSSFPAISADGRWVAFQSLASNLVLGDTNGVRDVFVYDRLFRTIERVSLTDGEAQANGASLSPSISQDGQFVAFVSDATNLVAGDTNGVRDVFVRDRVNGTTVRVSLADTTDAQANGASIEAEINRDGTHVVFESSATNLVGSDTNLANDVFVRELGTTSTRRVSVSFAGLQGNAASTNVAVSPDGRFAAFRSDASNLVPLDGNLIGDVFVTRNLLEP